MGMAAKQLDPDLEIHLGKFRSSAEGFCEGDWLLTRQNNLMLRTSEGFLVCTFRSMRCMKPQAWKPLKNGSGAGDCKMECVQHRGDRVGIPLGRSMEMLKTSAIGLASQFLLPNFKSWPSFFPLQEVF
jgi:hypothetical protein